MPPWSVAPPRQVVEPPARYRMATGVKEDAERRRCAKRIATKLSNRLHRTQARVLIDGLVLALRETRERGVEIADFLAGHDGHEGEHIPAEVRKEGRAQWNLVKHHSNPELALADLVDKVRLCLDHGNEWAPLPHDITPPVPVPPRTRLRPRPLDKPPLPGLSGGLVDVMRAAPADRFVERAMISDEAYVGPPQEQLREPHGPDDVPSLASAGAIAGAEAPDVGSVAG